LKTQQLLGFVLGGFFFFEGLIFMGMHFCADKNVLLADLKTSLM
jgi:hypothetical protein